jgi:hypothetical protein
LNNPRGSIKYLNLSLIPGPPFQIDIRQLIVDSPIIFMVEKSAEIASWIAKNKVL